MSSLVNIQRRRISWMVPAIAGGLVSRMFGKEIALADSLENPPKRTTNKVEPKFKRPAPNYPEHIPLNVFEKSVMSVVSMAGAFFHPERNEFIVALGETTAFDCVLKNLRAQMLSDPVGRQILRERPRMTSQSLDLKYLASLPDNTLGKQYVKWLEREGVSPDTREQVKYIDDEELAYVYQRYRECHDFYHTITGLPIFREGEIALKVFEFMNLQIPMAGLGALTAPIPINKAQRKRLFDIYYPWALSNGVNSKPLINVYWEKVLEKDIDQLKSELNVEKPPDLRDLRKKAKVSK